MAEAAKRIAFQRTWQRAATIGIGSRLSPSRRRITAAVIEEFGQALKAKLVADDPDFCRA